MKLEFVAACELNPGSLFIFNLPRYQLFRVEAIDTNDRDEITGVQVVLLADFWDGRWNWLERPRLSNFNHCTEVIPVLTEQTIVNYYTTTFPNDLPTA